MTKTPKIQLLYFPGCPNVEATKEALSTALGNLSIADTEVEDVNVHDPKTSENLKNYPSPSILVNGRDIEGYDPTGTAACRIYDGKGGVPEVEKITKAISERMED